MRWTKEVSKDGRASWVKKKSSVKSTSPALLKVMPLPRAQNLPIEDKKFWFELKCEERRISYMQDSITLVIERAHVLRDSFE